MPVNPLKVDVAEYERYLTEPLCGWMKPHEHSFRCWDDDYMALLHLAWEKEDSIEQLQESVRALHHRLAQFDTGTTGVGANSPWMDVTTQPWSGSNRWEGARSQAAIYDEMTAWDSDVSAREVTAADGKTYWQTSDGMRWTTKVAAADHLNLLYAFQRR